MSNDRNDDGGKTVIRPNPGGVFGQPAPTPQRPSPAQGRPSPQNPGQGAPNPFNPSPPPGGSPNPGGFQPTPQQPQRPTPSPSPFGSNERVAPNQGFNPQQSNAPADAWLQGADPKKTFFPERDQPQAPERPIHTIPLEVALQARSSEQYESDNRLLSAATPLLILLGRLRSQIIEMQAKPLMDHVRLQIDEFEKKLLREQIDQNVVRLAKYALCATADDIVQNLPGTDRHVWLQYSMEAIYFNDRTSGVGFFQQLELLLSNPAANLESLELMHACMSLGFEGQYRHAQGGHEALQKQKLGTYLAICQVRRPPDDGLSPNWRGMMLAAKNFSNRIPVWVIGAISLGLLLSIFMTLRFLLGFDSEALADKMVRLHPLQQISIERPPFTPPFEGTPPIETGQLERIRTALADDINNGGMNVDQVGDYIIIQVNNLVLFPSGKADVLPQFAPVAERIATTLDKEPGPVNIIGHTDNVKLRRTSRFKSNHELSVARARSVEKIVSKVLQDPARIKVDGKGELEPIADNKTKEGRAKNRRVEITIPREETL